MDSFIKKSINMFERNDALTTAGFEGSAADWLEVYKPLINDGKTVVKDATAANRL